MARTQFTFTFTNAQPGSVVSFDNIDADHLFAAATGGARLGHPLVLNAQNAISVWSDAAQLTATTEDGVGNNISATATVANPSVTTADGTAGQNPFSSGTSSVSLHKVSFAFDTPDLNQGLTIFTPMVGDILLDAWVQVDEVFDEVAFADIGTFLSTTGWFFDNCPVAISLTTDADADTGGAPPDGYSNGSYPSLASISAVLVGRSLLHLNAVPPTSNALTFAASGSLRSIRLAPGVFTATNPVKVVVSQDGLSGSAAIASTVGAATAYCLVASST